MQVTFRIKQVPGREENAYSAHEALYANITGTPQECAAIIAHPELLNRTIIDRKPTDEYDDGLYHALSYFWEIEDGKIAIYEQGLVWASESVRAQNQMRDAVTKNVALIEKEIAPLIPPPPAVVPEIAPEHWRVVDLVKHSLTYYGHEIVEEHYATAEEHQRFFGLLTLRSPYGNYTDTLGLRNSSDKSFPVSLAFGSRVFVCDNLAFIGEHTVKRRHTPKLKFELPGIIANIVEPLALRRNDQAKTFERYQATPLLQHQADTAIMSLWREGVIGVQRIADVHDQYENPSCDWGERSAYRLFNAATFALTGRVAERPDITRKLHHVIDGVCEHVA